MIPLFDYCRIAKGVACHHRRKRDLLRTQGKSLHTSTRSRLTQTPHIHTHTHIEHLLPIIYVQFTPLSDAVSYVTITTYPAATLFFFTFTRLFLYPAVRLPLTLLWPYFFFSSHLPCCAIIFLHTYPAVPLFLFALTLPRCAYPAALTPYSAALTLLCPYFIFTSDARRAHRL